MTGAAQLETRVYRGWYVVLAGSLTAFVAWGIGFYQLGVLLNAYHTQHGWNVSSLSLNAAIFCLIVGTASLALGPAIDRFGTRPILLSGAVTLSIGILGAGQVRELWQIYPVTGVLAVGFAATSTLSLSAVISGWFVQRRALAMMLTLTGAPFGALLLVPAGAWLLNTHGMMTGSLVLAAVPLLVIVPLVLTLLRPAPAAPPVPGHAVVDPMTARQGLRIPAWWMITLSFACIMFGQVAFLVHQVNLVQSIAGIGTASLLVGITGVFGIASRLLGWLGDRVSRSNLLACYCGVQSIAFLLAGWSTSIVLLAIASAIVGLSMGNVVALQPLLMGDRFGLPSLGALFGSSTFVTQCGSAAGIFVCGSLAGHTGSYSLSFSVAGILALTAAGLSIASGRVGD